jgi:hypothetical protein
MQSFKSCCVCLLAVKVLFCCSDFDSAFWAVLLAAAFLSAAVAQSLAVEVAIAWLCFEIIWECIHNILYSL